MNQYQKGFISIPIICLVILAVLVAGGVIYYSSNKEQPKKVACTQEAKTCPDGSSVSRTGSNCEFAQCPAIKDETAGWRTQRNPLEGFELKYPSDFFDSNQEPSILVGDCNYSVFPEACPNINNMAALLSSRRGDGDIDVIKNNISSSGYWKIPSGEKSVINNVTYCLYQTEDAAMSHTYTSYYYATVINNKCLVVDLNTSQTNCEVYLPIEKGNTEQQKNYDSCLSINKNQPLTLKKIISTFKVN